MPERGVDNKSQLPLDPRAVMNDYLKKSVDAAGSARAELAGYASLLFNSLKEQIADFQSRLKPDEEVAALLASFGTTVIIRVSSIGYRLPHLIMLKGYEEGSDREVELLQHVSQVNILLKSIPVKPGKQRRTIGFDIIQT